VSISVLIADDQALVRAGFRMVLDIEDDIIVCGEAANGREAVSKARGLRPDVVLMDVRMPEMDGIEAAGWIRDELHDTGVLMLTTFDMDEYVYRALQAGAAGFLLKDVPPEQLADGIRAVAAGDSLLAPSVTRRLIEEYVRRPPAGLGPPPRSLERLTAREREVLHLLARGQSNAEITKTLVISETTVKTDAARILTKLQLRDRIQAVVYAYESGLLHPGERQ
jgi:DNA-binding NarL/FixJ family response regulator